MVDSKMADLGVPTTSELKKLKVVELKAKLQEFGLPISGNYLSTNPLIFFVAICCILKK